MMTRSIDPTLNMAFRIAAAFLMTMLLAFASTVHAQTTQPASKPFRLVVLPIDARTPASGPVVWVPSVRNFRGHAMIPPAEFAAALRDGSPLAVRKPDGWADNAPIGKLESQSLLWLDHEHWPGGGIASIEQIAEQARAVREAIPGVVIGFYGTPPMPAEIGQDQFVRRESWYQSGYQRWPEKLSWTKQRQLINRVVDSWGVLYAQLDYYSPDCYPSWQQPQFYSEMDRLPADLAWIEECARQSRRPAIDKPFVPVFRGRHAGHPDRPLVSIDYLAEMFVHAQYCGASAVLIWYEDDAERARLYAAIAKAAGLRFKS